MIGRKAQGLPASRLRPGRLALFGRRAGSRRWQAGVRLRGSDLEAFLYTAHESIGIANQ
ncbi:MAG: hypothetical protein KAU38_13840 [Desulfobacterales bacterium]|nr:hypothetical protein [Desulfobacterales bacterium]